MGYSGKYLANDDTYALKAEDALPGRECTVEFRPDGSLCIAYYDEAGKTEWVGPQSGVGHWVLRVAGTNDSAEMHQFSPSAPYIEGHCSEDGASLMWRIKLPGEKDRI